MMELVVAYLPLFGGLVLASVVAGLLAGFLGVGGGIVLVPTMFWMFTLIEFDPALAMHMAVATSLGTIIFTAVSSTRSHRQRGGVDEALVRRWGPFMAAGALGGGLLARALDTQDLLLVFGGIALLVAINFLRREPFVLANALPQTPAPTVMMSGGVGLVSSLMGIGGGTLGVPLLSAYSYPITRAVGTSAAFGLIIAVPATIGFVISGLGVAGRPPLSVGYVSLPAVCAIIPITTLLAPVGARLAHRVDGRWVKLGFAVFLGLTAVRMLMNALS